MRGWCAGLLLLLPACAAESLDPVGHDAGAGGSTSSAGGAGGARDAGAEPPAWLGDAGLAPRAPVQKPLRALCGIASTGGNLPTGDSEWAVLRRAAFFEKAADLGIMIRRDVRWDEVEPTQGTFDFGAYDALVAEAEQYGVPLLATLLYGTLWARPGAADIFFPPDDPADFAAYASAVATRYQGRFVGYEIWNEPNAGYRFWKTGLSGDSAGYAELLVAAGEALHAADPQTPVLLGGTVFTPQIIDGAMKWLGEAYAAEPTLPASFDVAGVHTYQTYPPNRPPEVSLAFDPTIEDKLSMHSWLLAQHDGAHKPMWIAELGWPVAGPVDEAAQARYTVRATLLAARAGAGAIFWYTLLDGPNPEKFPPEDAFGLFRYSPDPALPLDPKPVYGALEAMLDVVGERWPDPASAAFASLPDGVRAITFAGTAPGSVHAMWTVLGEAATLPAPQGGEVREQDGSLRGSVEQGAPIALSGDVTYLR